MLMLVLTGTVFILWLWSRRNRNKDEPPVGSGSKILIGHTLQYAGDSIRLWNSIKKFSEEALQCGGVIKTTVGPPVLYDPKDFLTISNACLQKDALYDFGKAWLGDGLVTSPPSKWKIHRKLLNPAFSQHVLDNFMDVFNNQSRDLVNKLKVEVGKGPFDLSTYTKQNALETICLTALGVNSEKKSVASFEFFQALTNILKIIITRFQKFWLHNNLLFNLSSLKRKETETIKVLHKMSNAILKYRKEIFVNSLTKVKNVKENTKGPKFKPFIELTLELSHERTVFTDREIREHVDTIIVTGHDTTANVVMLCALLVGSHSRVQKKNTRGLRCLISLINDLYIIRRLNNVFGDDDRDVTKQDFGQLVYLDAVIRETMRIYPVVPIIGRQVHKDIKLGNCTLSKGNSVIMSIYGVYRHSMWGPDVEEFRPERWLDSYDLSYGTYGLTIFGIGRRTCIGKTYALMSMKVTLAHIYRNYKVHGDHTQLKLKVDVMLKPVSGYNFTIESRNKLDLP